MIEKQKFEERAQHNITQHSKTNQVLKYYDKHSVRILTMISVLINIYHDN